MGTFDLVILAHKGEKKSGRNDLENKPAVVSVLKTVKTTLGMAGEQVTDAVIATLRTRNPGAERLAQLDRATHCLDAMR